MGKHLIISVHGIRDFGKWQDRLGEILNSNLSENDIANQDFRYESYKYGYFSLVAFIIPILRFLVVRNFAKKLSVLSNDEWQRIDLVGHSFGTHVIAWALRKYSQDTQLNIHTIILSGSVLQSAFPWHEHIGKNVKRVINDCGAKDAVLLLSQFLVLFTGMAGRVGFSGSLSEDFTNRFNMFGHGGYFRHKVDGKLVPNNYMQEKWVPLLLADKPIKTWEDERPRDPLSGFQAFVFQLLEPIKLFVYATPFLLLWTIYLNLYDTSVTATKTAEAATEVAKERALKISRNELSSRAKLLIETQPSKIDSAIQHALQSNDLEAMQLALKESVQVIDIAQHRLTNPSAHFSMTNSSLFAIVGTGEKGNQKLKIYNGNSKITLLYDIMLPNIVKNDGYKIVFDNENSFAITQTELNDKFWIQFHNYKTKEVKTVDKPFSIKNMKGHVKSISYSTDNSKILFTFYNQLFRYDVTTQKSENLIEIDDTTEFNKVHWVGPNEETYISKGRNIYEFEDWTKTERNKTVGDFGTDVLNFWVPKYSKKDRRLFSYFTSVEIGRPVLHTQNIQNNSLTSLFSISGNVNDVLFHPNEKANAVYILDDLGRVYRIGKSGYPNDIWLHTGNGPVSSADISEDGNFIMIVQDKSVRVLNTSFAKKYVGTVSHKEKRIVGAKFINESTVASIGNDGTIRVWSFQDDTDKLDTADKLSSQLCKSYKITQTKPSNFYNWDADVMQNICK